MLMILRTIWRIPKKVRFSQPLSGTSTSPNYRKQQQQQQQCRANAHQHERENEKVILKEKSYRAYVKPADLEAQCHTFQPKAFKRPKNCQHCKQLIWNQGSACKVCKYACHKRCESQVLTSCIAPVNYDLPSGEPLTPPATQQEQLQFSPPKGIMSTTRRKLIGEEEGFGELDLTYITERMIAMSFPDEGAEMAYRSGLREVTAMLKNKHGECYMICNLSERRIDLQSLNPQMLEFGWPDFLSPPLERLCSVCKSIDSWLNSDTRNVVVLHCKGGRGRIGVVIAAYMHYSNICASGRVSSKASADQALDRFAMKRFYDDKLGMVVQPSQRRYVHYFAGLLSGAIKINSGALFLHHVIIHRVPNFDNYGGCRPFIKVYQAMQPIYTSPVFTFTENTTQIVISLLPCLQLRGDILIKCYHKPLRSAIRDVMFRCQFHTCAISNYNLVLNKHDLDDSCSDSRFPESSKVELIMSRNQEVKKASDTYVESSLPIAEDTSDPLVRWDSYENFDQKDDTFDDIDHGALGGQGSSGNVRVMHMQHQDSGPLDGNLYARIGARSSSSSSSQQHQHYQQQQQQQQQHHHHQSVTSSSSQQQRTEQHTHKKTSGSHLLNGGPSHISNGSHIATESTGHHHQHIPSSHHTQQQHFQQQQQQQQQKQFYQQEQHREQQQQKQVSQEHLRSGSDMALATSSRTQQSMGSSADHSQLDDIITELLGEQIMTPAAGTVSRQHPNAAIPSSGSITTQSGNTRTVLSWNAAQAGPTKSATVSSQSRTDGPNVHSESSAYHKREVTRSGDPSLAMSMMGLGGSSSISNQHMQQAKNVRGETRREVHHSESKSQMGTGSHLISGSGYSTSPLGSPTPPPRISSKPYKIDYENRATASSSSQQAFRDYSSDSEQPLSWLEQQKEKLRAKQSVRQPWMQRTREEQQLVHELQGAQTRFERKRAQSEIDEAAMIEQYGLVSDGMYMQNGPSSYRRSPSPEKMPPLIHPTSPERGSHHNRERERERARSETSFVFRTTSPTPRRRDPRSPDRIRKSSDPHGEKTYFVSGLERPPFTSHQTKYVFSISPPKHSAVANTYVDAVAAKPPPSPAPQRASAPASPLIPQRSSSRDVLRSRSVTREWSPPHGRSLQRQHSDNSLDRDMPVITTTTTTRGGTSSQPSTSLLPHGFTLPPGGIPPGGVLVIREDVKKKTTTHHTPDDVDEGVVQKTGTTKTSQDSEEYKIHNNYNIFNTFTSSAPTEEKPALPPPQTQQPALLPPPTPPAISVEPDDEEIEEEVISLEPIGRGMMNLEPKTTDGGRTTPSFSIANSTVATPPFPTLPRTPHISQGGTSPAPSPGGAPGGMMRHVQQSHQFQHQTQQHGGTMPAQHLAQPIGQPLGQPMGQQPVSQPVLQAGTPIPMQHQPPSLIQAGPAPGGPAGTGGQFVQQQTVQQHQQYNTVQTSGGAAPNFPQPAAFPAQPQLQTQPMLGPPATMTSQAGNTVGTMGMSTVGGAGGGGGAQQSYQQVERRVQQQQYVVQQSGGGAGTQQIQPPNFPQQFTAIQDGSQFSGGQYSPSQTSTVTASDAAATGMTGGSMAGEGYSSVQQHGGQQHAASVTGGTQQRFASQQQQQQHQQHQFSTQHSTSSQQSFVNQQQQAQQLQQQQQQLQQQQEAQQFANQQAAIAAHAHSETQQGSVQSLPRNLHSEGGSQAGGQSTVQYAQTMKQYSTRQAVTGSHAHSESQQGSVQNLARNLHSEGGSHAGSHTGSQATLQYSQTPQQFANQQAVTGSHAHLETQQGSVQSLPRNLHSEGGHAGGQSTVQYTQTTKQYSTKQTSTGSHAHAETQQGSVQNLGRNLHSEGGGSHAGSHAGSQGTLQYSQSAQQGGMMQNGMAGGSSGTEYHHQVVQQRSAQSTQGGGAVTQNGTMSSPAHQQLHVDTSQRMLSTGVTASPISSSSQMSPQQMAQMGSLTPNTYSMGAGQASPGSVYYGQSRVGSVSSLGGSTLMRDSMDIMQHTPRFVRDTSKYWYKPHISREDAINLLKDKPPGTFVVRDSNSFPGAFGLALKVAHVPPNVQTKAGDPPGTELVRHFLIEPTPKGVKLKGCSNEPVFGSLASLVYQHSITPLALPCKLLLPDSDTVNHKGDVPSSAGALLAQGAACNVLFVASVDTESLTGPEAIAKAVKETFGQGAQPKTTVVHFKVNSQGVTLTDNKRRLFFRRHYPVSTVTYCGMDPEDRRVFGFVARKQGSNVDNACHLFAELDSEQPASAIVNFVTKVMIGQGRPVKS